MSREGSCRSTILIPGENTFSMNSQLLCFCVRYMQVWAFESQACFRILGTHFLTKNSQQEIAGRRHTLDLELSYLERTENIQKQNQSHELPGKTNTKSYFLNCTSGRVCSGRIWKGGRNKSFGQRTFSNLGRKHTRAFHCGTVSFRLTNSSHRWRGTLICSSFPSWKANCTHFSHRLELMAAVLGQGSGHPICQILKGLDTGSRKDTGHVLSRTEQHSVTRGVFCSFTDTLHPEFSSAIPS